MSKHNVTLLPGDGIGPEVVQATTKIIDAAGASITWEPAQAGAEVFKQGLVTGVPQDTLDSIAKNKVALKGPLETPIGYGEKSANVTLRKIFETYGNIRPVKEIPGVRTPFSGMGVDFILVRENVEDLYAGIEHMQTPTTAQCLKLISRPGCEKIVRMAFEIARSEGRKKVVCATKANIMKLTEGLLKKTFEDISQDYKDIEAQHMIVDNCAHQMALNPGQFDVMVMTNMNGDILSDLGSALVGGLGIAPGANIGKDVAIFEAVHGSAPDIANRDLANPLALLQSGIMMLRHLGEFEIANAIEQAVYVTLDIDKILTHDMAPKGKGVGTKEFTDCIIKNIGKKYTNYKDRVYKPIIIPPYQFKAPNPKVSIIGADVFVNATGNINNLGDSLKKICADHFPALDLKLIAARGMIVYPDSGNVSVENLDHFCCRFITKSGDLDRKIISDLLMKLNEKAIEWMHVELLHKHDEKVVYAKAHGEI